MTAFIKGFEKQAKKKSYVKWHHKVRPAVGLLGGAAGGAAFGTHLTRNLATSGNLPLSLLAGLSTVGFGTVGAALGLGAGCNSIPDDIQMKMMKGVYKDPYIKDPKVRAELKKAFG